MAKLKWDLPGEHFYETGIEHGVLYVLDSANGYTPGVAWNGLTSVNEAPSGAESNPLYADNIKYLDLRSKEDFGCTIEAYTYPNEWYACDGSLELVPGLVVGQQARKTFGLCYKTSIGNDVDGDSHGYKLHLVYGCTASPSERQYQTTNDSPEAATFSWEVTTVPVEVTGAKPTAILTIDSTKFTTEQMTALEEVLYGTDAADPRLPLPDEVAALMGAIVYYDVRNYLTNVETDNTATVVTGTYSANLTAKTGYTIENVIVTMGGEDITDTAYTNGAVSIASVTGPIVIFATANEN